MVSKQVEPTPEFQMQSEDFPALPGASIKNGSSSTFIVLFSFMKDGDVDSVNAEYLKKPNSQSLNEIG